jgi:hypothetical protein
MRGGVCPQCERDNPAARYADTCLRHRVQEGLPAHYFDCARVQDGHRCDCTATVDIEDLLAAVEPSPAPDTGSALLATVLLGLLVAGLVGAFLLGEQRRCDALREQGSALVERYCGTEAGG